MVFSTKLKEEVMKKLAYKGRKTPSKKTCISKVKYATVVLASITKNENCESFKAAYDIMVALKPYLTDIRFPTLEKIILKIMDKGFCKELLGFIVSVDDPIILAALCYVKFKHLSILDDRIFSIYHLITGNLKKKVDFLFKEYLPPYINNIEPSYNNPTYRDAICISKKNLLSELVSPITQNDMCISKKKRCLCFYNRQTSCLLSPGLSFFRDYFFVDLQWGNFTDSKKILKNKIFEKFVKIVELLSINKLKDAKSYLLSLLRDNDSKNKNLVYNLLALVHFYSLEYHETIYYLNLQIENSLCFDRNFALQCKFLVETVAEIPTLTSSVSIFTCTLSTKNENFIRSHFENKFLLKRILGCSFNRIILFSEIYCDIASIDMFLTGFCLQSPGFTNLFIFCHNQYLHIYEVATKAHTLISWNKYESTFKKIMFENQATLSMIVTTQEDKQHWWASRIKLDRELKQLIEEIKTKIEIKLQSKVVLILEDQVTYFPFELVFDKPCLRLLSRDIFNFKPSINIKSAFYLLDPGNNLLSTRDCISNYFVNKQELSIFLNGVVGRSLHNTELKNLANNELFMYFGHGSGKKYFELVSSKPSVLFLFGCSSCKLIPINNFKSNGYCLRHLKKRRVVLGNLWDVTDKDLDKLTLAIINDVFAGVDVIESIHQNRKVCKLKYLNSAALVIYGSPSEIICNLPTSNNTQGNVIKKLT